MGIYFSRTPHQIVVASPAVNYLLCMENQNSYYVEQRALVNGPLTPTTEGHNFQLENSEGIVAFSHQATRRAHFYLK